MKWIIRGGLLYVSVLLGGCGPGVKDGTYSIVDQYYFSDAGGYEKMILRRSEGKTIIVIDARVDDFVLKDGVLWVARKPRETFEDQPGVTLSKLSSQCEFWKITVKNHALTGPYLRSPLPGLACH